MGAFWVVGAVWFMQEGLSDSLEHKILLGGLRDHHPRYAQGPDNMLERVPNQIWPDVNVVGTEVAIFVPCEQMYPASKENKMSAADEAKNAAAAAGAGAATGAAAYGVIGGVAIAVGGTAFGITLLPFTVIGGAVALAGYGIFRAGKSAATKNAG